MLRRIAIALAFATGAHAHLARSAEVIAENDLSNGTKYDFVIVGGGIAGLTVADRLTENPNGLPTS